MQKKCVELACEPKSSFHFSFTGPDTVAYLHPGPSGPFVSSPVKENGPKTKTLMH